VVTCFLNADDNLESQQILMTTFWPMYNVPWNLHTNSFRGLAY